MISSLSNERIKYLVKLQKRKYRDLENEYIVEGEHLVNEAIKANCVKEVFILKGYKFKTNLPVTFVSSDVMKKISTMDTSSNVVALCKKVINNTIGNKILILDELQDPGNLGTIIRSSVAFNIDTIILGDNTVDLYNPKVLRATQGMYNHINIFSMNAEKAITEIKKRNIPVYGTNVKNGIDVRSLGKKDKNSFCLILGNEGNGVKSEIQDMCDENLYIKMNKNAESLNVGVACSILLYEMGDSDE